jgi:hypothetical protein
MAVDDAEAAQKVRRMKTSGTKFPAWVKAGIISPHRVGLSRPHGAADERILNAIAGEMTDR